jgi:ribosomal protein S18 acetylase RimI-like enzyme
MRAKSKLIVRRTTPDDLAAIMRIENASFGCSAWGRDDFLDYLAEPETCIFLVAVAGDVVAGYIIGFYKHNRAEVDSVAVKHSHRGRAVPPRRRKPRYARIWPAGLTALMATDMS